MYYYIYDSFTRQERYAKALSKISLGLADLGIAGEEVKCTPIKKIEDLVFEGLSKGYKNIIACGDDRTAFKVINCLAQAKNLDICFGLIPLRPSKVAQALGIPSYDEALRIISKRRIEKVDLGKIDGQYFLVSCLTKMDESLSKLGFWSKLLAKKQFLLPEIQLQFEEGYKVSCQPVKVGIFNILNGKQKTTSQVQTTISPFDGLLDVVIVGKLKGFDLSHYWADIQKNNFKKVPNLSRFRTKKVKMTCKREIPLLIDNYQINQRSFSFKIEPKKLKVIVGIDRGF